MNLRLNNKNFLVCGSSRGIGKAIAATLLKEGASVAISGRNAEALNATAKSFSENFPDKILKQQGDLNDDGIRASLISNVIRDFGELDGVVLNVGGVRPSSDGVLLTDDDWSFYLDINLRIAHRLIKSVVPILKNQGASIIFIGSIAGIEEIGAPSPYSASKAALNMYAKSLSRKLAPHVRVNTVNPGNIIFPGGHWEAKQADNPEKINNMINEKVPLECFGVPDDIANMVAYLLSPLANFITGSSFVIDGGQSVKV